MSDWKYTHQGNEIPRPNHGLVHTLRTVTYVPHVVRHYIEHNSGMSGAEKNNLMNDIPWIQKIGLEMKLNSGMDLFKWYGKGPFETYPDRKTGARTGIFSMPVDSIRMPYVITQGFGNHTDVRWLELRHRSGTGMKFESEEPMNFTIDPYENLKDSWYPYQLKKAENVSLNIDKRVSGVGGTPITVRHQFRTYPDEYHYQFSVHPIYN